MLALPSSNRLTLTLAALLILGVVAAFPCVVSATTTEPVTSLQVEADVQPYASLSGSAGVALLDSDPFWGPLVWVAVGYIAGKIIDSATGGAVDRAVDDAISFVVEAYEKHPPRCNPYLYGC